MMAQGSPMRKYQRAGFYISCKQSRAIRDGYIAMATTQGYVSNPVLDFQDSKLWFEYGISEDDACLKLEQSLGLETH